MTNADGTDVVQLTHNDALDWVPLWSPDGTRIVFSSDRDGDFEIFVMNADGSDPLPLTDNDYQEWTASWSPDGTQIAFDSDRDGDFEIFVMNADGTGVVQLTHDDALDWFPLWSPDGTRIVFESDPDDSLHMGSAFHSTPDVVIMNADGTGVRRLTHPGDDSGGSWSPDGTRIAFTSSRDGDREIFIIDAEAVQAELGPVVSHSTSVFVEGTGYTTESVTLDAGLWTAASHFHGDGSGQFIVRLVGPPDSSRPLCWNQGRGVVLADSQSGSVSVYSGLPVVVADTDDAWCSPGEFTLEVTASGRWMVVLINESPLSGDSSRGDNGNGGNDSDNGDNDNDDGDNGNGGNDSDNDDGDNDDGENGNGGNDSDNGSDGDGRLTVGGILLEPPARHPRQGVEPTDLVFVQISVGDRYACGVTDQRGIECWGYDNTWGQASPPPGEFLQVAAGDNHTCALTVAGEVQCWGDGYYGQTAAPEGTFVQVTAEDLTSCALRGSDCRVNRGTSSAVPRETLGVRPAERLEPGSRDRLWSEAGAQVVEGVGCVLEVVGVGDFDGLYRVSTQQDDLHSGVVSVLLFALAVGLECLSSVAELLEADLLPCVMVERYEEVNGLAVCHHSSPVPC